MGKRDFKKYLIAIPLTAGLVLNTQGYTEKQNYQKQNTSLQNSNEELRTYVLDPKARELPSPQLATNVVQYGLENSLNQLPKENVKIETAEGSPVKRVKVDLSSTDSSLQSKIENSNSQSEEEDSDNKDDDGKNHLTDSQKEMMRKMVKGTPISEMMPYIEKRNPVTAVFMVAIAKKESSWGVHSPHSQGRNCFNYWGFKDRRFKTVMGGHSCFPSPEQAVESVGNRIDKLVAGGRKTPSQLVVWKCGSACSKDGNAGKWISDVSLYFNRILNVRG